MTLHYRQGDVLLMKVERLPEEAVLMETEKHRVVLAYGEVTGHAHAISTDVAAMYSHNNERFLHVTPGAELVHEEHSTIFLEPGVYKVVQQREYTPQELRFVRD